MVVLILGIHCIAKMPHLPGSFPVPAMSPIRSACFLLLPPSQNRKWGLFTSTFSFSLFLFYTLFLPFYNLHYATNYTLTWTKKKISPSPFRIFFYFALTTTTTTSNCPLSDLELFPYRLLHWPCFLFSYFWRPTDCTLKSPTHIRFLVPFIMSFLFLLRFHSTCEICFHLCQCAKQVTHCNCQVPHSDLHNWH